MIRHVRCSVAIDRNGRYPAAPMWFHGARFTSRVLNPPRKQSQSVREGYAFQERLGRDLSDCLGEEWTVLEDFWLEYEGKKRKNGSTKYHAGPDFVLLNVREGRLLVIDAKRSHTDSYCQIWRYMALLRSIFPKRDWSVAGCEIHKHSRTSGFAGEHEWVGEELHFDSFVWDGRGFPKIAVMTWNSSMEIL